MSRKKTIHISELIDEVNRRNAESECSPEVRRGWNSLLEAMLHQNNVYEGFRHLNEDQVPAGSEPGVRINDKTNTGFEFPDESRVYYFKHKSLRD